MKNMVKISQADIVVGIPTYNEADCIRFVAEQIDAGLQKYYPDFSAVIVNADNHSPDNTKKAFLDSSTVSSKIYLNSGEKILGKGINVLNIFKEAAALKAKMVLLFDGDLESIGPFWIQRYVETILEGYDFVTPVYARNEYDGSITNHLCCPLLAAIFSSNIRQPIGGDFALSGSWVRQLLTKKWDQEILKYGVDILLTVSALAENKKIAQVFLGRKDHKPSLPKLGAMYLQVTKTLFRLLSQHRFAWRNNSWFAPHILYREKSTDPQSLAIDYKYLKTRALFEFSLHCRLLKKIFSPPLYQKLDKMFFREKKLSPLSVALWCDLLAELFKAYQQSSGREKEKIVEASRALYFARQVAFIRGSLDLDHRQAEKQIINQVKYFHRHRQKFISEDFQSLKTEKTRT